MPYVQARVNLLERTEEFDQSPWLLSNATITANSVVAPDGTTTADTVVAPSSGPTAFVYQSVATISGQQYTATIYLKESPSVDATRIRVLGTSSYINAIIDWSSGTPVPSAGTMEDVGNGWYRFAHTGTADSSSSTFYVYPSGSNAASDIYVWGAQLEQNSTATTYQRVTTATDYADIGLPRYLEFDGVDDAMATQSVDFTGTDEVTLVAGQYKASDATTGILIEAGPDSGTNGGTFGILAPSSSGGNSYRLQSRGTGVAIAGTGTFAAAPDLAVISGLADISANIATLRRNATVVGVSSTNQGSGNYTARSLYIGARTGTSLEFNGRIHQLIIRGATTAGALLDQTEAYVARKTGVPWYSVIQSPASLFEDGEVGAWYDPSDLSSLYEDAAGTTPITQLGQPVGLMLDKSQGALTALGPQLVTNGDFSDGATGWSTTGTWSIGSGYAEVTGNGTFQNLSTSVTTTIGKWYEVKYDVLANTLNGELALSSSSFAGSKTAPASVGSNTMIVASVAALPLVFVCRSNATSGTLQIDNVSVREIPGNHASQSTAAARPTVEARVNLAEGTDSLTGWTDQVNGITRSYPAVTTPNGIPAVLAQLDTSPGWALERVTVASSGSHVYSMYVKAGTAAATKILFRNNTTSTILAIATFTFASPSGNYETLDDGWYRIWVTSSSITAGDEVDLYWYPGNDVIGASAYGAGGQLEEGSTVTTYQRVTTATDYADVGAPVYLQFDGVDDALSTASIDFTSTDEMTVCAGVYKASDALEVIMELTSDPVTTNGGMQLILVGSPVAAQSSSRGTIRTVANGTIGNAPRSLLLTSISDISSDSLTLREGGAVIATNTGDQGTGNYADDPIYIGARGGSSLEFEGRIHQLIIRGKSPVGNLIRRIEEYVANKTGVSL